MSTVLFILCTATLNISSAEVMVAYQLTGAKRLFFKDNRSVFLNDFYEDIRTQNLDNDFFLGFLYLSVMLTESS